MLFGEHSGVGVRKRNGSLPEAITHIPWRSRYLCHCARILLNGLFSKL